MLTPRSTLRIMARKSSATRSETATAAADLLWGVGTLRAKLYSLLETTMQKFQAARLMKLAAHLATVPKKEFDMENWYNKVEGEKVAECGTVACALGIACQIPSFKAAGLKLIVSGHVFDLEDDNGNIIERAEYHGTPVYGKLEGCEAGEAFFGLTDIEGAELFLPEYYNIYKNRKVTPSQVIKKIKTIVKSKYPELLTATKTVAKPKKKTATKTKPKKK
jgi:hypothetical protein